MPTKIWSLYVVECSDGTLYTGISTDVDKRIRAHNLGKGAKYTQGRCPVMLLMSWQIGSRSDASKAELNFKKNTRSQKLTLLRTKTWKSI